MPQNWWEMFPEVQPPPAARPRPLPGPGGMRPEAAMQPLPTYGALAPDQVPAGAVDPSYFSGGASGTDELQGGLPDQIAPSGSRQPPFAGNDAAPVMDRNTAIQHAAAAIQRGADPNAVRARLHEMGHAELYRPSPFSDLIPGGAHELGMTSDSGVALTDEAQPATRTQGASGGSLYPSYPQQDRGKMQRRADPSRAPQKLGAAKFPQSALWDQVNGRANEIAGAAFGLANRPSAALTPSQRHRRAENEAALNDPVISAFLDTISFAEGGRDYNTMFGTDRTFDNLDTHPGQIGDRFHGTPQTAAGRYQIELPTYLGLNQTMGRLSMRAHDQDLMAAQLIRSYGGMAALRSGQLASAVSRLAPIWAGFPEMVNGRWVGSHYRRQGQRAKSFEEIEAYFNQRLQQATQRGQGHIGRRTGLIRD